MPIEETVLNDVVSKAKDWALMHGGAMRSKADFNPDALQVGWFICRAHAIHMDFPFIHGKHGVTLLIIIYFGQILTSIVEYIYMVDLMISFLFSKTCFSIQFAPFILTPTAFPRREFEKAVRLQPILNELMHWVAHDTEFLRETLANTIKVDEFTGNLFKIYERILNEHGGIQVIHIKGFVRGMFFFGRMK